MARIRLAVALLLPRRTADEVDGIRRAFGADPAYIPPHVTLVPPVNVADDDVAPALAVLRRAAAATGGGIDLTLGPLDTFLPANPVLFLAVDGSLDRLAALRDRCTTGPFDRPDPRPYVPHVTVTRGLAPDDDSVARRLLGAYRTEVVIERLHLLVQVVDAEHGRHWLPTADMGFEAPRTVGIGGLDLEITVSDLADPEVRRLVSTHEREIPTVAPPWRSFVVAGRRQGEIVGVAWGRQGGRAAVLDDVLVPDEWQRDGVGSHLLAEVEHEAARRGAAVIEALGRHAPAGDALLHGRGWTERPGPGGPRTWRALGPDDADRSDSG